MHMIESGNVAAALGVKLARAQVIAAYPITPQTPLTEKLSELVESDRMEAEYIPVESEHSALSVCIAASSTGTRAFTATSANGLLYMHEQINWAAGARLPIVMCVANRGLGAPWTVWNDHQDSISQRDTGWIQLYACDHQQIIDTVLKAYYIAEKVSVPVMVCYDGYLLSHTYMPFDMPDQDKVDTFLPPYNPDYTLDPDNPANLNTVTLPDVRQDIHGRTAYGYMEIRQLLHEDMRQTFKVAEEAEAAFCEIIGRPDCPFVEEYRTADADYITVAIGSLAYQLRDVIDALREEGIKIGVAGIRMYRPFPDEAIRQTIQKARKVIVMEKALSYGYEGPLCSDIKAALYHENERPEIGNIILGLGGREIKTEQLLSALKDACNGQSADKFSWLGLKL